MEIRVRNGKCNDDYILSTPTPSSPLAQIDHEIKKQGKTMVMDTAMVAQELSQEVADDDDDENNDTDSRNDDNDSRIFQTLHMKRTNQIDNYYSSLLSHNNKIRLLYFFFRFSTGSLVPFMSLYMQQVGLRPDQIGTLQAIRPIVTMTSAPLWGGLADRTGRKKMVLMGTFLFSFLFRLSACFTSSNIFTFGTSLCISSVFYAPVSSLLDSIVVSSMDEVDKVNFGRFRLYGELGNGVASSILLSIVNTTNNDRQNYGYNYLFGIHAITSIVAWMCMLYCVPTSNPPPISPPSTAKESVKQHDVTGCVKHRRDQSIPLSSSLPSSSSQLSQNLTITPTPLSPCMQQHPEMSSNWREGLRVIFSNMQILLVFGLVIITGYSLSILENFCYINIRQFYITHDMLDVAGRDIGFYRICYSIGGTLAWWYAGSLSRKLGSDAVMIIAVGCLPLCFFGYAGIGSKGLGIHTKLGFVIAEALRSGIFAALWSNATVRVNKLSPSHVSAIMQTMMEGAYRGIGHTSGSYLGGLLCRSLDIPSAFFAVGKGLVSFLCLIGAVGFYSRSNVTKVVA